jgi:hypothetical protein
MTEQKLITQYNAIFKTYLEYETFVKEFNKIFNIQDGYFDSANPTKIYASYHSTKNKEEHDNFLLSDFYLKNKNKFNTYCTTVTEINYRDNPTKIVDYTVRIKQDDSYLDGQQGILKQRTKTLYDAGLKTFTESFKLKDFNDVGVAYSKRYNGLKIKMID